MSVLYAELGVHLDAARKLRAEIDAAEEHVRAEEREVLVGMAPELTERERVVARYLIGTQMTCSQIASTLYVSANTVKTHTKNIYKKVGVYRRRDLAEACRSQGVEVKRSEPRRTKPMRPGTPLADLPGAAFPLDDFTWEATCPT
jgi:DNA-binding NarL/FixJ family response regulator